MDPPLLWLNEVDQQVAHAFWRLGPRVFNALTTGTRLSDWLNDMELLFEVCHIGEHLWVPLATRRLQGDPLLWWYDLAEHHEQPNDWAGFRPRIMERYALPQPIIAPQEFGRDLGIYQWDLERRYILLSTIWQAHPQETMHHYGQRFIDNMMAHIPLDRPLIISRDLFWSGLPFHIRDLTARPGVGTTLDDLMAQTLTAEINAFAHQALQQAQAVPNVAPAHAQEPIGLAELGEGHMVDLILPDILVNIPEEPFPQVLIASDDEADDVGLDPAPVVPVVPEINLIVVPEPVSDVDD